MGERIAADGGTQLALRACGLDPVDTVQDSPEPGSVLVYYKTGVGMRLKLFGQAAQNMGGGGLSSPLTTKGDLWGFDSADNRVPIGSNGQVLTADSTQPLGLKWASAGTTSPLTTKGDVYTYSTVNARLAVGSDGQVLTADSTQATGLKWATPFTSPLTTKGDILTHSTVDARLAVGSDGQILVADSTQTAGIKWTNPNIQLVQTIVVSVASDDVTFSGLDGDADGSYLLKCSISSGDNAGGNFHLQPNGADTNCASIYFINNGSALAQGGVSYLFLGANSVLDDVMYCELSLKSSKLDGLTRGGLSFSVRGLVTAGHMYYTTLAYRDNVTKITSLKIHNDGGTGTAIGIGSVFSLYKLVG